MEQFIVSARKYRPNSFSTVIGQDNISTTLRNSILRGQLGHAYLFCGPRGVGKTTTARIFAKSINCLSPLENAEPCGKCESCLSFQEGRSYCIHELDAASNNSVDDIRNLTDQVRIPPQIGKYSVYIIDEVHMLSAAAFNAFLKTLEEPPSHAVFILATTEKHKILPTILSRCQTYDFNRITIADMVLNLSKIAKDEGVTIDSDALHIIAQKADGAMRDALTLFDQTVAFCGKEVSYEQVIKNLNVLDYEYYFKIVDSSLQGDYTSSLMIFDEILKKGFNALHFISGLSSHLRDLMICKNQASKSLLSLPPTLVERYDEQSAICSIDFIYNALSLTVACEGSYRLSGNQRLLIEFTMMKLAFLSKSPDSTAPKVQTPASAPAPAPAQAPSAKEAPILTPAPAPTAAPAPVPTPDPAPTSVSAPDSASAPIAPSEKASPDSGSPAALPISGKRLSLKEMLQQARDKAASPEKSEEENMSEPFNYDHFIAAWKELAKVEADDKKELLSTMMLQNIPEVDEENMIFTFYVLNSSQQNWIQKKTLQPMITFMRKKLKNSKITIVVDVIPTAESDQKLYMPSQKAEFLLKKSDELKDFSKDLDLDIK